jgi:hypothetical protein
VRRGYPRLFQGKQAGERPCGREEAMASSGGAGARGACSLACPGEDLLLALEDEVDGLPALEVRWPCLPWR